MIVALTGFLAGALHVLTGPDHLAAVAPLSLGRRRETWRIGLRWGLGHAAGVTLIAILAILLRGLMPIAFVSTWGERLVGVSLIGVGLWAIRRALACQVHTHEHEHDGIRHIHIHMHAGHGVHDTPSAHAHAHVAAGMGVLHGCAGSAHVLGVLPALVLPTTAASAVYVAGFGVGTIGAMMAFSAIVGFLARSVSANGLRAYRAITGGCAAVAIAVGITWLMG